MGNRYLTKSKFKTALDCPSKLFYADKPDIYANLNSEDEFLQALAEGGYQVEELAKLYYPHGYNLKDLDSTEALRRTDELLKKYNVTIYEAAIKFKNCFIRIDILEKVGNRINLIEVKAKSFNSNKDKLLNKKGYIDSKWKHDLYDIAFQNWIIKNAFPHLSIMPYLMVTDKTQPASIDGLNQLFKIVKDKSNKVEIKTPDNIENLDLGKKILINLSVEKVVKKIWNGEDINPEKKSKEELKSFSERIREYSYYYYHDLRYPAIIGKQCKDCEFQNNNETSNKGLKSGFKECWKENCGEDFDFSEPHIFELWNFRKVQELIDSEIYYMKDIPKSYFLNKNNKPKNKNKERQYLQLYKTLYDNTEYISDELYDEMATWKFPLHFIDFETTMVAIPFNKGRKPYEQIAFQFSSHTLYSDGTVKHDQFLFDKVGEFPNFQFIKELKNVLNKDDGTILRYAMHENTVLRHIRQQMLNEDPEKYNNLISWIDTITEYNVGGKKVHGERNMVDLQKMVERYYYHPYMKGSNSIKAVLPAVLAASKILKDKYSKPLNFGTQLKDLILWQKQEGTNKPEDPYKLLPSYFSQEKLEDEDIELLSGSKTIKEGSAAATAYAKMQFAEMSETERNNLRQSLLQYCELDTLAMLMIYEHWQDIGQRYNKFG